MAFSTSRIFTSRRRPPRLAGGIIGSINAHSPSVRSLGYRRPLRAANRRCFAVHIWCLSQSMAPYIESQPIPLIQQLSGSALSVGFVLGAGERGGLYVAGHRRLRQFATQLTGGCPPVIRLFSTR